ncbi:MAG: hypothetical protein HYT80_06190 [Euryarchaeota archaeon]|nr:hypothetical protein [Euryarchaeota archaeon]
MLASDVNSCRCGDGRRPHGRRGEPSTTPYSTCLGYEPRIQNQRWPAPSTLARRAVWTFVRLHLGVQQTEVAVALGMSRNGVHKILAFLEARRLVQHAGPRRQPYYYPLFVGGERLDASRHYHRYRAPYAKFVRLVEHAGPMLFDQIADALERSRFNASRLLTQAVAQGVLRRIPGPVPSLDEYDAAA